MSLNSVLTHVSLAVAICIALHVNVAGPQGIGGGSLEKNTETYAGWVIPANSSGNTSLGYQSSTSRDIPENGITRSKREFESHDGDEWQMYVYEVLDDPDRYSSSLRPHVGDHADNIVINIVITSFGPIYETKMEYQLDIDLQMTWNDPRLESVLHKNFRYAILSGEETSKIWVPDLFFTNERRARFHDITTANKLVYIEPTGKLFYSMRLTLVLSCPMDLHDFPFDRQTCRIEIESYGYPLKELQFLWNHEAPINFFLPKMDLPQFILEKPTSQSVRDCTKYLKTGNFTCIEGAFHLKRDLFYFLVQNFIPCILTVFISWVAFYLHTDSVIGRAAVGFITNLTMITQLAGAQADLPKVNYAKAIDIYVAVCMLMVFCAILELAFVHQFSRKAKEFSERKKKLRDIGDLTSETFVHDKFWGRCANLSPCCLASNAKKTAQQIDIICRFLFPFAFALFNVIYWPVYMMDY